jgi:hypothetical protein
MNTIGIPYSGLTKEGLAIRLEAVVGSGQQGGGGLPPAVLDDDQVLWTIKHTPDSKSPNSSENSSYPKKFLEDDMLQWLVE